MASASVKSQTVSTSPTLLKPVSSTKAHSSNPNTILSRKLLETYFKTFDYPFVRHHIDSFDNFLIQDIPAIIKANNPFLLLKQLIPNTNTYKYRLEIFIGGISGTEIEIGTPTVSLQKTREVRVLFPNEARLRNLTYSSTVYATVYVRVTIPGEEQEEVMTREYKRMPIFQLPILLHSRFCMLHGKPASFLKEAGECPNDQGGYFIVEGSEKILITKQEQAFNTMYIQPQPRDPKVATYGNLSCLSPITKQVKVVSFHWMRATDSLVVTLPYVRKPVPIFVLFRAMGIQSDKAILSLIYPDLNSSEAKQMIPLLLSSIAESVPFFDTYSAVQFIKAMTKGFSENHVYDILYNQTFIHIADKEGGGRLHFLADCVRRFMRVHAGIDPKSDRDDTRNQRCLTSGFLIRMLFTNSFNTWKKAVILAADREFEENKSIYEGQRFINIFNEGNTAKIFKLNMITEGIMRGFKGKWVTGGAGGGGALGHSDEKTGVLQPMSRMSYLDFMSHCRRVSLNFDTGMKLTGPRQLHGSQYGFFCTNETPGGASIGIAKNLSLMTLISNSTNPQPIVSCLIERGWIIPCNDMRTDLQLAGIPMFVNNGIIGYTIYPHELVKVLKLMKWTGCLPALSSVGFNIRNRCVFLFVDEGRPTRPLIHIDEKGIPSDALSKVTSWRDAVLGTFELTKEHGISTTGFLDPFADTPGTIPFTQYITMLEPHAGLIEYVDPYEQNESFIINFPEHYSSAAATGAGASAASGDASHMEIHPCTIISVVNGMIPFANFNQSPRNQLSCSQSKQGVSMYATNFFNRYDNAANIMCYGEAPLVRTVAYDMLGSGTMPYGTNLIMGIMSFNGYNQDDGIVFNEDSFQRGMFRNINFRCYECFEEVDKAAGTTSTIANPIRVHQWNDLKPGRDYTKLDERGIIKTGELVDENTVLVGKYIQDKSGRIRDSSLTAQVWTSGRVESVGVTVSNQGLLLVKVRITQDRIPELGDKFSTRHGQKGTMGMIYRSHDMPRTADGLVPDMLVNPHCIPSRMTIAQLMEMIFGQVCYENTMIGDATIFTSDSSAPDAIGRVLESQFGLEKTNNVILYDGASGRQMETTIFIGPVFAMRLKHMTEDKWNARAEGRREQRTRQPTGGRGQQGGLRIGEMERDALAGHGITGFLKESLMERADKSQITICNGCGTVPIYNEIQKLFVCSLCDGPVNFIGTNSKNMEILPTIKKSIATRSIVEMPYATKLLADELQTYMNMGLRILTGKGLSRLGQPAVELPAMDEVKAALAKPLPERVMPETRVPEFREAPPVEVKPAEEDLYAMGVIKGQEEEEEEELRGSGSGSGGGPLGGLTPQGGMTPVGGVTPLGLTPQAGPYTPVGGMTPLGLTPQAGPYTPQGVTPVGGMTPQAGPYTPVGGLTPQYGESPLQEIQGSRNSEGDPYYMPATPTPQQPTRLPVQGFPIQTGGASYQYVIPQPIIYQSPIPGGPNTITIDTSPRTMQQGGFMDSYQRANAGEPVMGSFGMKSRHRTPRRRPESPKRGGKLTFAEPVTPATRITINKLD